MTNKPKRRVGQEQLEILEGLIGKTLPSFKHLTTLVWGTPYYDTRSMYRDKKRLEEVAEIEYSQISWQVKIVKMK